MDFPMPPKQTKKNQPNRERIRMDAGWSFYLGDLKEYPSILPIPRWHVKRVGKDEPKDHSLASPSVSTEGWELVEPWKDAFNKEVGYAWFRTELPDVPGPGRNVHFTSISDDGDVFLNGKHLAQHSVWTDPFDVALDDAWKKDGPNHLAVLVKNGYGSGFIGYTDLDLPLPPAETQGPHHPDFDDRSWRPVHLPHDFVVEGSVSEGTSDPAHGFLPKNIGWYRHGFDLPASDKGRSLWIDFDGVSRNCKVWLNGHYLGRHKSGYTAFRFDITKAAIYGGRNVLTVRVDARGHEGWWYEGGGIYRHVWLNKSDANHVAPWGVFVASTPKTKGAILKVETTLQNDSNTTSVISLVSEAVDPKGKVVLKLKTKVKVPAQGRKTLAQKGRLAKASHWSVETPHLYRWITRLLIGTEEIDRTETIFGIRSIRFDANLGFLLNGKPVKLKGTCNHQDHAGVGVAIPDRLWAFRLERLQAMGSNAYRCAHNPPAPELLDECDRRGVLVIDENRRLGDSKHILEQVESMILRDRNHPSIVMWSICNEEPKQGTDEGRKSGVAMKKLIKKLDPTRPVTAAMNGGWGEGLTHVIDVQGFNYNIVQYEPFRAKHPRMPVYGSETASTVSTRGEYTTDKTKGYVSAYNVNHPEWAHPADAAWRPIAERPSMAGAFIWTGFDYRGEPTPYDWPCINSHFGILDMCGFPKDNFWYYKSWWGSEPVLHLFPHWNWAGREGEEIDVWVHSNYDQVELFINNRWIGLREVNPLSPLQFKVRYEPGTLVAKGYRKGVLAAETKVETTGTPASIRLTPWKETLMADGEDVIPVTVEILDAQGRCVPTASDEVTFEVTGAASIAGVGNGDPSSHEPDQSNKRKAFHGLCQVLLKGSDKPGTVTLVAQAKGLPKTSISLKAI
jgi:beta-galactosidase